MTKLQKISRPTPQLDSYKFKSKHDPWNKGRTMEASDHAPYKHHRRFLVNFYDEARLRLKFLRKLSKNKNATKAKRRMFRRQMGRDDRYHNERLESTILRKQQKREKKKAKKQAKTVTTDGNVSSDPDSS